MTNNLKLEEYIQNTDMISLGKRRADLAQSRLKIKGWSQKLKEEVGIGYAAMVINSQGEQFGDKASDIALTEYLDTKDFAFAKSYIEKMSALNSMLLERVDESQIDLLEEEMSTLLAYFFIIRSVIENVFEIASPDEQKYIEDWRNDTRIFSSLERYLHLYINTQAPAEWSMILAQGNVGIVEKIISCTALILMDIQVTEVRGKVGYPGVIQGKARVVVTRADRDAVEVGEIIVAAMTTLDFLPAMERAAAFVTDEGGITCHAAIVARELKKPCIIGTKNGTRMINTGNMIEVNGDSGVVKILS